MFFFIIPHVGIFRFFAKNQFRIVKKREKKAFILKNIVLPSVVTALLLFVMYKNRKTTYPPGIFEYGVSKAAYLEDFILYEKNNNHDSVLYEGDSVSMMKLLDNINQRNGLPPPLIKYHNPQF